jgi:hypothetical protein
MHVYDHLVLCFCVTQLSKPVLLATLVRVASAVARLHLRGEVLEQPDASLAVLLMEHTLANKVRRVFTCGLGSM